MSHRMDWQTKTSQVRIRKILEITVCRSCFAFCSVMEHRNCRHFLSKLRIQVVVAGALRERKERAGERRCAFAIAIAAKLFSCFSQRKIRVRQGKIPPFFRERSVRTTEPQENAMSDARSTTTVRVPIDYFEVTTDVYRTLVSKMCLLRLGWRSSRVNQISQLR